jgi:hypothetical protein
LMDGLKTEFLLGTHDCVAMQTEQHERRFFTGFSEAAS